MSDRRLIAELRDAPRRPHVELTDADREFARSLRGRHEFTERERPRAERIFTERVDW